MKKIVAFALAIVLTMSLVACECVTASTESPDREPERFVRVERFDMDEGYGFIYADVQTGVMYAAYFPSTYRFGFTPLLNADGTPMIWEEFSK